MARTTKRITVVLYDSYQRKSYATITAKAIGDYSFVIKCSSLVNLWSFGVIFPVSIHGSYVRTKRRIATVLVSFYRSQYPVFKATQCSCFYPADTVSGQSHLSVVCSMKASVTCDPCIELLTFLSDCACLNEKVLADYKTARRLYKVRSLSIPVKN